ncbi:hypothetical protein ACFL1H_05425 [Nanoarchaeota archaeon]
MKDKTGKYKYLPQTAGFYKRPEVSEISKIFLDFPHRKEKRADYSLCS